MADQKSSREPRILATFEITLRPDADGDELARLVEDLHELARSNPDIGAIDSSSWAQEDGTLLVLYTFQSAKAMRTFVQHPAHLAVMRRGDEFFTSIRTQIATLTKQAQTEFAA